MSTILPWPLGLRPRASRRGPNAAAEEGEGITIEGILWGLIPGSSLVDGYEDYQKGNYVSAAFNGAMGLFDLVTMGAVSKAKAIAKSGVRAIFGGVKQTAKNTKNLMDDGLRLVRGNIDNAGKGLIDDAAGGAKVCRYDVETKTWKGCFAAGTPILTSLGSKPIEEIAPGDWVLSQDESDPEAVPQPRVVEEVCRNLAQMMTLRVGDHTIETTPEHPFWVRGRGWTPAEAIELGDELRSHDGQWVPLDAKEFSEALIPVFNMRVAEDHTYFVGSPLWGFSVWAHNRCFLKDPITEQLTTKQRDSFRNSAARTWKRRTGQSAGSQDMEVHHRIPLEWSHIFPNANPNRKANLIAIRKGPHDQIDIAWRVWKSQLNGRIPTQAEVLAQALRVDNQFSGFFVYIG